LNETTAGKVPAECPSVGVVFGSVTGNNTIERNLTALLCSQGINQVPVTVEYRVSRDSISQDKNSQITGIRVRGNSQKVLDATSRSWTFGYRLQDFMESSFRPFIANGTESYDSFFNHLVLRVNGSKREDLVGPKNAKRLVQAVSKDYSEYMNFVIDRKLRAQHNTSEDQLLSASDDGATYSLSLDSVTNARYSTQVTHLVIEKTSKLVLQILLVVMTVFSFVGFMLVKIRGTLPRDPCSIGSTMAFLADSQLCDRRYGVIPHGAEYMNDKQLRKALDGWVFSLGWWQRNSAVAEERQSQDALDQRDSEEVLRNASPTVTSVVPDEKRFGIDVGKALT
jgi:hypothetical protein